MKKRFTGEQIIKEINDPLVAYHFAKRGRPNLLNGENAEPNKWVMKATRNLLGNMRLFGNPPLRDLKLKKDLSIIE